MKQTVKRIFCFLLIAIMTVGLLPSFAAADDWPQSFEESGCTHTSPTHANGKHHYELQGRPTDPTCTESGKATYRCAHCGATKTVTKNALGHDWGKWKTTKKATCETEGRRERVCNRCQKKKTETIPATGHDWDEGKVTKEPTATEPGIRTYTCKNDPSHTYTEEIPPFGSICVLSQQFTFKSEQKEAYPNDGGDETKAEQILYDWDVVNNGNQKLYFEYGWQANGGTLCDKPGEILLPGSSFGSSWAYIASTARMVAAAADSPYAGTITLSMWVVGYDADAWTNSGEKIELCRTETYTVVWNIAKPDDNQPLASLLFSIKCDAGAGNGKRYAGAWVAGTETVTNTGSCPVTIEFADYYCDMEYLELAGPHGIVSPPADVELLPGESVTALCVWIVQSWNVVSGVLPISRCVLGKYQRSDGSNAVVLSNTAGVEVPLTYPEGSGPNYALLQTVSQTSPVLVSYPNDGGDTSKAEWIHYNWSVTNVGDTPVFFRFAWQFENDVEKSLDGGALLPGESASISSMSQAATFHMIADAPDSPYAGTVILRLWIIGYNYDEWQNSGKLVEVGRTMPYTFNWKIDKPGDAPVSQGFLSLLKEASTPADPNGFQLGETIYFSFSIRYETGDVNPTFSDVRVFDEFALDGKSQYIRNGKAEVDDPNKFSADGIVGRSYNQVFAHTVTQEDVNKGYFENYMYMEYLDRNTGERFTAYSNTVIVPVTDTPTTPMAQKFITSKSKHEGYYTAGEQITYAVYITNNTQETYTDVEVMDTGLVIGTIDTLFPGVTVGPFAAPTYTVTDYDTTVTGYVYNVATASATNSNGVRVSFSSNTVTVWTMPNPKEQSGDPVKKEAALSIVKKETSTPGSDGVYSAGDTITYSITLTNTGVVKVEKAMVRDSLEPNDLGLIGTIEDLLPGESATLQFSYTVTEQDVEHGSVINRAIVNWMADGKTCIPVESNTVVSPTGKQIITVTGGFTVPNGGTDTCKLTLTTVGESEAHYTLTHCSEHAQVAEQIAELTKGLTGYQLYETAAAEWRNAIDAEYDKLYACAWGEAAAAVLAERNQFAVFFNGYREMLYTAADRTAAAKHICTLLEMHLAELCCAYHTADDMLPDSLMHGYTNLLGTSQYESCASNLTDGVYTEQYGDTHAAIFIAVRSDLNKAAGKQATARVFELGTDLWRMQLDADIAALYNSYKTSQLSFSRMRVSLDGFLESRRACFGYLYPNGEELVAENVMQYYRIVTLAICELVEVPENTTGGWSKVAAALDPNNLNLPNNPTLPGNADQPESTAAPTEPEETKTPAWVIVVIVAGVIAVLAFGVMTVALIMFINSNKKKKKH